MLGARSENNLSHKKLSPGQLVPTQPVRVDEGVRFYGSNGLPAEHSTALNGLPQGIASLVHRVSSGYV